MSYLALDRDLLTSSLWATGSPAQVKVWIYLLLEADPRTGVVEDAAPAVALRCGLPLPEVEAALEWLAAPDPHSRTRAHDGRRIALEPGGIRVLNYVERSKKDHARARLERFRDRLRASRDETLVKRDETLCNADATGCNPEQGQEQEQTDNGLAEPSAPPPPVPPSKRGRDTWLTPYLAAWAERTGGELPPKRAAATFGPLRAKRGAEPTLARWRNYLASTAPVYASPERFAATFGTWAHPGGQAGNWDTPDVSARAHAESMAFWDAEDARIAAEKRPADAPACPPRQQTIPPDGQRATGDGSPLLGQRRGS